MPQLHRQVPVTGLWGYPVAPGQWPGDQEDESAMVVRGGFQGSSYLSTDT